MPRNARVDVGGEIYHVKLMGTATIVSAKVWYNVVT